MITAESKTVPGKLAVLVLSCDKYSDLWKPFFTLFFKYWDDCPFEIYLCTNEKVYPDDRVTSINTGEDVAWTSTVKKCLEQINSEFVLLLQEDFLFRSKVDTERIYKYFGFMKKYNAGCLRLYPSPLPEGVIPAEKEIGEILPGSSFRVSLQSAIWEKEEFAKLLVDGENPWEFEHYGSIRSNDSEKIYLSLKKNDLMDYFSTAVIGGIWLRNAVYLCRKEGIAIDYQARKVEPLTGYLFRLFIEPIKHTSKLFIRERLRIKGFKKPAENGK
jgi:hypothetical protein